MIWTQEAIDYKVSLTLPPDVKVKPKSAKIICGGWFDHDVPVLFTRTLGLAMMFVLRDNDTRLLDALRNKWPEAVEAQLPKIRKDEETETRRVAKRKKILAATGTH